MDDIVKQAMAKWPNVPHCHGWLALDARGAWRMRDDRAQALNLPGDKIVNPILASYINRNYTHDEQGRWYFQNGPQRVYVNLEATPYIAHTDPVQGFVLHTGEPLPQIEEAWLTESGQLIVGSAGKVAAVDDRDVAQCIADLRTGGKPIDDERLLAWLDRPDDDTHFSLRHAGRDVPVRHTFSGEVPARFGFVRIP
ncbi:MAG TPA: DUF2946 family protein [Burkholderiaceae bacterium]|nr:DUF2946 family protein [Burkholderiaceae bacterium]